MSRCSSRNLLTPVAAVFLFAGGAFAGETQWLTSPDDAVAASTRSKRPILVYFTGSYCHYCREMDRSWRDPSVDKTIASNFIPLKIDIENFPEIADDFEIDGVPTTVIISPDHQIARKTSGAVEPRKLNSWLNLIVAELSARPKAPPKSPANATTSTATRD